MKHIFRGPSQIQRGETIASLEGVTKNLRDIQLTADLEIAKGEFVVITGESGSGKSTLLRTMAALERPDEGKVTILGNDLYQMKESKRSKLISDHVGVGFQAHNLDTGLTLKDNLESLAEGRGKVDYLRMGRLLVALGLQEKGMRQESVATLSGGEKQRVAIGRTLLSSRDLVLLDEPTASLDPHGKSTIYEILQEMNETEDTTFVIVSHDTVARDFATREIILDQGRIVADHPMTPRPYTPAA